MAPYARLHLDIVLYDFVRDLTRSPRGVDVAPRRETVRVYFVRFGALREHARYLLITRILSQPSGEHKKKDVVFGQYTPTSRYTSAALHCTGPDCYNDRRDAPRQILNDFPNKGGIGVGEIAGEACGVA